MSKDGTEEFKVIDRRGAEKPEAKESTPQGGKEQHSEIDLSTFILSLATGAPIHMGLAPDPMTQTTQKNLELARQNIDLLALLQNKTKGNLTPEESKLLENLLTEVRLRFVQASA